MGFLSLRVDNVINAINTNDKAIQQNLSTVPRVGSEAHPSGDDVRRTALSKCGQRKDRENARIESNSN